MPLYPYRCTQCGHRFEKIQRFRDKPEKVCPKCGGALERIMTAPGLQFKGAGWYVNDYAPKGGSSSGDGAVTEKKTETKTEAKTESKSESKAASGGESNKSNSTPSSSTSTSSSGSSETSS